ncbi:MAG: T9SS type A sorting domain-containing protein [Bacteroidetes bacterium]|nr:T9SS type A sorting domain-containing protein [Bacteroidota bacterium]MBT6688107.1 T9SS type A sorting domain-containing protein [Bacteroidota bacterium]MBT7144720.1 T9SS type A sorting domain-containing protein [Bacteroidota bacterium]MBT7492463.1 T9SS type A sorting domain-containing protein [Bacteroidota bacterium]
MENIKIIISIFAFFFFANFGSFAQIPCKCNNTGCDWTIPAFVVFWDASIMGVTPGQTVCIEADTNGKRNHLVIENLSGTDGNEIIVRPCDNLVTIISSGNYDYGIKFRNCKHFILTGSEIPNKEYGIKIKLYKSGEAISTKDRCKDFVIKDVGILNPDNIIRVYKKNMKIQVFNIFGQLTDELIAENQNAGNHTLTFSLENYKQGTYFYSLTTAEFTQTRKMSIIK